MVKEAGKIHFSSSVQLISCIRKIGNVNFLVQQLVMNRTPCTEENVKIAWLIDQKQVSTACYLVTRNKMSE